jgi:hypothetical protein
VRGPPPRRQVTCLALLLVASGSIEASAQEVGTPAAAAGSSSSGLHLAGAVLAVVAMGALGAGAYYSVRVGKLERDIEAVSTFETKVPEQQISRKVKAGERAQTLQWAGYGTALAAGAAAAVLLAWAPRTAPSERERPRTTLRPLVVPAASGALAAGGSLRVTF